LIKGRASIITPTYNRPRWLPDAIESVLAQTYSDIEIIVVNDGSTDNTEEILEPYMDRITYIYKENGGQGTALNAGIEAATGEYIGRVDDDDLFAPKKVELQVEMFRQNPQLGFVATYAYIIDSEGDITDTREVPDFSKHGAFLSLLQHCIFCQPSVIVRKECYDAVGLYKNIFAEDYDMWIRIARHYPVDVVREPLTMYRRHDGNLSGPDQLAEKNAEIGAFICEMMEAISMEELIPGVRSIPHAHDVKGAIFLRHNFYKRAGREFHKAVKADPQDVVHGFWSGRLLRHMGYYENSDECFGKVPPGHELYSDAQNALELTSRFQTIDHEDEDALTELRKDLSKEHEKLMDITIELAAGR